MFFLVLVFSHRFQRWRSDLGNFDKLPRAISWLGANSLGREYKGWLFAARTQREEVVNVPSEQVS